MTEDGFADSLRGGAVAAPEDAGVLALAAEGVAAVGVVADAFTFACWAGAGGGVAFAISGCGVGALAAEGAAAAGVGAGDVFATSVCDAGAALGGDAFAVSAGADDATAVGGVDCVFSGARLA